MESLHNNWNESYRRGENYLFYPNEEVIRFTSKNIYKQTSLDSFEIAGVLPKTPKMLDLGCGIGRHIMHAFAQGIDAYGIDLSDDAIQVALEWADRQNMGDAQAHIRQGDITALPWPDTFFDYAISHGVLDSMPFEIAVKAVRETFRVLKDGALFYCDLIAGDDSNHTREYCGEETVRTTHECGTIQSYFNYAKILELFSQALFEMLECFLIKRQNIMTGDYISRYHLVFKKK